MTRDRDVAPFEQRAPQYDEGWRGRVHHDIADRTAALVLTTGDAPRRVLDLGCGTGYLLRRLARELPEAIELAGIDPAPSMIDVALAASAGEPRIRLSSGVAEELPFADGHFDLVLSTTSFDHWMDQQAGLRQCARVLVPGGRLVLVDQFSNWLVPTLVASRRDKARTPRRVDRLLTAAGFRSLTWRQLYALIIKAVTARTSATGAST